MKIPKPAVLLFAILSLMLGCFDASAADASADMKALQAVDQAWLKAFNTADAEGLAKLYDEHAMLLPPNAPAAKGRAAIKTMLGTESSGAVKAGLVFSLG